MIVPLLIAATLAPPSPPEDKLTCLMERISEEAVGPVPKLWAVVWDDGSANQETQIQISDPVIGGIRTLDVKRNPMSFDANFDRVSPKSRVRSATYHVKVVPSRGRLELTAQYEIGDQGQSLSTVNAFGLCYRQAVGEGARL